METRSDGRQPEFGEVDKEEEEDIKENTRRRKKAGAQNASKNEKEK